MKRIMEGSDETIGEKEIAGQKAKGFRVISDDQEMELWVDAKTGDPIQIEIKMSGVGSAVMSDFNFDVELDDSLFDVTPPEGYEIQTVKMDMGNVTEDDLLAGLRFIVEFNDNIFDAQPFSMKMVKKIAQAQAAQIVEEATKQESGLTEEQQMQKGLAMTQKYARMAIFMQMVQETWHWQGGGVKFDDSETPICWYKLKDATDYRVVYGDLSVKDTAKQDLPEIKEPVETNE